MVRHNIHIIKVMFIILAVIVASLSVSAKVNLNLQVKIDPPVHDCRFLPTLTGVPDGVGIVDVQMDLYENATKQFSYTLMHRIYDEPLAAADFLTAFDNFEKMPDGFFADGLGYYHTTWHYYRLVVQLSDGSHVAFNSRPFRVPENPFHMFCAQLVTEPYMGTYTHKPGSQIVYQVNESQDSTARFLNYKTVPYSVKYEDMYANPQTTWRDIAFVYAVLPDEAYNAKDLRWVLTAAGDSKLDSIVSTDKVDFAYGVRLRHFGEETFNMKLTYTLTSSTGADSIVSVSNHQLMKMRLPTPCFAYDNAAYTNIQADETPADIVLTSDNMSGIIKESGIYSDTTQVTMENARLLHLDMYTYLFIAPNVFDDTNLELKLTIKDTKYPDNKALSEVHTYGPYVYTYDSKVAAYGVIKFKDCKPSDWLTVDPATGKVTPIPHKLEITYASSTNEFYYSPEKNTTAMTVNASFGKPTVGFSREPEEKYHSFVYDDWHEYINMHPLTEYNAPTLYFNNRTSIPEQKGDEDYTATEYYAVGSRWIDTKGAHGGYYFGYDKDKGKESAHLVSGDDLMDVESDKSFFINGTRCGDGHYTDTMMNTEWFSSPQYEVNIGRVYMFATNTEPQIEISVSDNVLPLAGASSIKPRRVEASRPVEAFVPTVSDDTFTPHHVMTSAQDMTVDTETGITAGNGYIDAGNKHVDVYTITGSLVYSGKGCAYVTPGVYIAVTANGAQKVFVK